MYSVGPVVDFSALYLVPRVGLFCRVIRCLWAIFPVYDTLFSVLERILFFEAWDHSCRVKLFTEPLVLYPQSSFHCRCQLRLHIHLALKIDRSQV